MADAKGDFMRKKISMLIVALAVLAGGVLLAPKEASAFERCPPYCWDPACTCVFHGWWMGGSCVYEDFCTVE
jgi:hypothetical protein